VSHDSSPQPHVVPWKVRKDDIAQYLSKSGNDIITLQEVRPHIEWEDNSAVVQQNSQESSPSGRVRVKKVVETVQEWLNRIIHNESKYKFIAQARNGDGDASSLVILYNQQKLILQEVSCTWTPDSHNKPKTENKSSQVHGTPPALLSETLIPIHYYHSISTATPNRIASKLSYPSGESLHKFEEFTIEEKKTCPQPSEYDPDGNGILILSAKFKHKDSGIEFWVDTCHFPAGPRQRAADPLLHLENMLPYYQARTNCCQFYRDFATHRNFPLYYLTGDFNFYESTNTKPSKNNQNPKPEKKFGYTRKDFEEINTKTRDQFNLQQGILHHHFMTEIQGKGTYMTWHSYKMNSQRDYKGRIDRVYSSMLNDYNSTLRVEDPHPLIYDQAVSEAFIAQLIHPYLSDHVPIIATIDLVWACTKLEKAKKSSLSKKPLATKKPSPSSKLQANQKPQSSNTPQNSFDALSSLNDDEN
jgi:exonuclease III